MSGRIENRAIVTIAIGRAFQEMAKCTHPLMQEYAARCNARFLPIVQPRFESFGSGRHTYEKFQLFDLLTQYDRIAFIDNDILVQRNAPNLFEIVPPGTLGAVAEEEFDQVPIHKRITQEELGAIDWTRPYFNAGMMVLSRSHKPLFDPHYPGIKRWATDEVRTKYGLIGNDQPYFNYRVNQMDLPFMDLGYRFNHTRVMHPPHHRFRSYLIHGTGPCGHRYGPRLWQIQMDARIIDNPFFLSLSSRFPAYRWAIDRCHPGFFKWLKRKWFD